MKRLVLLLVLLSLVSTWGQGDTAASTLLEGQWLHNNIDYLSWSQTYPRVHPGVAMQYTFAHDGTFVYAAITQGYGADVKEDISGRYKVVGHTVHLSNCVIVHANVAGRELQGRCPNFDGDYPFQQQGNRLAIGSPGDPNQRQANVYDKQ